jgi:hypothetical protein
MAAAGRDVLGDVGSRLVSGSTRATHGTLKSMKRGISAIFGTLILTGCVHHPVDCAVGIAWSDCLPGTAGFRDPPPAQPAQGPDDTKCRSYGLKYGTGDYAQCRLALEAQHNSDAQSGKSPVRTPAPPPLRSSN